MAQFSAASIPQRWGTGIDARFVLPTVLALLALVGAVMFRMSMANRVPLPAAPVPTNPAIEERWGIHITQLALSADGGMVDLRYQIVDPNKALPLIETENTNPQDQAPPVALIAEDSGDRLDSIALMPPKHDLAAGRTYFLLFHNTSNAIKTGRPVSIAVGDFRLEHVVVR